jgi:hypothetical protein
LPIADIPVESTPVIQPLAEAAPDKFLPTASVSMQWFDVPDTTEANSGLRGLMSSYAYENVSYPSQDKPAITEADLPAPDRLPVRAMLSVFASALLLASIVARLVFKFSAGSAAG